MPDRPKSTPDGCDPYGRDKQQGDLIDRRGGARDGGGDARDEMPEGLRREPKGPYDPSSGRR